MEPLNKQKEPGSSAARLEGAHDADAVYRTGEQQPPCGRSAPSTSQGLAPIKARVIAHDNQPLPWAVGTLSLLFLALSAVAPQIAPPKMGSRCQATPPHPFINNIPSFVRSSSSYLPFSPGLQSSILLHDMGGVPMGAIMYPECSFHFRRRMHSFPTLCQTPWVEPSGRPPILERHYTKFVF